MRLPKILVLIIGGWAQIYNRAYVLPPTVTDTFPELNHGAPFTAMLKPPGVSPASSDSVLPPPSPAPAAARVHVMAAVAASSSLRAAVGRPRGIM